MKKKVWLALFGCVLGAQVFAQVPAERAVQYRQSGYYLMGQNLSQLNLMLKGEVPFNKAAAELNADAIVTLSRMMAHAYPAGSGGGESKAKPEVWTEAPKFRQLQAASQAEAEKLQAAVRAGDQQALRSRFSDLSKSCKACHNDYKLK